MSYRNSNLLYRPTLSIWTARKLDKDETVKVNSNAGAVDGAANVHKQLLPDCAELEAIRKWSNAFRTWVYLSTSPWDDSGWRVRAAAHHMDFVTEAGDRITEGQMLVDRLMVVYRQAVSNARFTLNELWRASDYPTEREARRKFNFAIDSQPIPDSADFRGIDGISPAEADRLVKNAEQAMEDRFSAAMRAAYDELYGVVAKMANTLEGYGNGTVKKFNDSLVDNIHKLVEVMPALNLTGDPHLTALCAQAQKLANYSCVDLRTEPAVRDAAIVEARTIAMQFKGFVTGSEGIEAPDAPARPVRKPALAARIITTPTETVVPVEDEVDDAGAWMPTPNAAALFSDML